MRKKKQELQERLKSITQNIAESAWEVQDRIAADSEQIREEEAAKAKAVEQAENVAAQSGAPAMSGAPSESADVVDISVFAQNVAAFAPARIAEIPIPQPVQVGEVISVKA